MANINLDPHSHNYLNGKLIVAMPHMADERFARAVIYICAHSREGAMGIILNQAQNYTFPSLLMQLRLIDEAAAGLLPQYLWDLPIRQGGPVDRGHGFVLHSDDYCSDSTLPVSEDVGLTATVDILNAIAQGRGPKKSLVALGYAGWGEGQLEDEIIDNSWLIAPCSQSLIFDGTLDGQYHRILASIGVNPMHLVGQVGNS
ncbi:YqgE/AlgH family protein [Bartonella sp. HY329]|uniref:YqgE/AlgH family protein n=1 Tax=unclassified Bartonella TaxID=2645622 RepID=UPI0021C7ECB9|nr:MULTISPECIES: YqgE/AlgH family protein [unclassified Bartonella]UXM96134.1 YqgE/AlgH family protein [Bartonella sp. HY329]UXN10458.1 YqgE/AlgH family protein [Bartonella sp. HY328]